jgi:peroxiredoxin
MLEANSQAPSFTLLDGARKPVSLSDFQGKTVVLVFFPAAFTGVCTKELCSFRDSISAFNDVGATVLGI